MKMLFPVGDVLHADCIGTPSGLRFEYADYAVGIPNRQRTQQNRVHHAENGGAGSNRERERHKRGYCGKRILAPDPQRVTNILS